MWTNLDEWSSDELEETFDIIIVNDSLENTINPEEVLTEIARMLKKDGKMIISFGNSNHFSRIGKQLGARRLFSRRQMGAMLAKSKLSGNAWAYTQVESNLADMQGYLQKLEAQFPAVDEEELRAYQWIVLAKRFREDIHFDNKMVVCMPTCGHPQIIEDVLQNIAEMYKRYALDVYFYDSSKDDETKKVIKGYQEKGYDNLYYIAVDPEMPIGEKCENIFMAKGIERQYKYMWYLRERCWCGEKTLELMYSAVNEEHDVIFLDVGNPNRDKQLSVCHSANQFYHECGEFATSMDTTIYNMRTMLKTNFCLTEFKKRYAEPYRCHYLHFLIIFDQLSHIENPSICLLAGENVTIYHSKLGKSSWGDNRIQLWGPEWIDTNEALPDCYTNKGRVIKKTASLPWILGDASLLVDLQQKGILTPEKYEEIKGYWERVSTVPLEVVRMIAYGTYQENFMPLRLADNASELLNIYLQVYQAILNGKLGLDRVPFAEMHDTIKNRFANKNIDSLDINIIETTLENLQNQTEKDSRDVMDILTQLQVYISMLLLIEKI